MCTSGCASARHRPKMIPSADNASGLFVYIHTHTNTHIYIYIHIYIYKHVYIYIYTSMCTSWCVSARQRPSMVPSAAIASPLFASTAGAPS